MTSTYAASESGLYLYGITATDRPPDCSVGGVAGAEVEAITEDRVVAVVSRLGPVKVRPQRSNLAAHHRILRDLGAEQPVLPVVFGTIVGSEAELRRVLRKNREALARLLERLRGKVEMGLKVFWDLPNVFDYFVATHQELEVLRNRLFRPGRSATVEEKVELGELFVSLLQQARQRHTQRVKESLAAYSVQVNTIDPGDERMIMKLACLVEKDRQPQWEQGVRQAAQLFDDHYRFDYSGPWPPYSFVDIDLELAYAAATGKAGQQSHPQTTESSRCMFLLDDIFLAPLKGLAAICQKVHQAAQEDLESQEQEILAALADLHQQLDTLKIGEQDFDAREGALLDRLDACQRLKHGGRSDSAEDEAHGQDSDDGR